MINIGLTTDPLVPQNREVEDLIHYYLQQQAYICHQCMMSIIADIHLSSMYDVNHIIIYSRHTSVIPCMMSTISSYTADIHLVKSCRQGMMSTKSLYIADIDQSSIYDVNQIIIYNNRRRSVVSKINLVQVLRIQVLYHFPILFVPYYVFFTSYFVFCNLFCDVKRLWIDLHPD